MARIIWDFIYSNIILLLKAWNSLLTCSLVKTSSQMPTKWLKFMEELLLKSKPDLSLRNKKMSILAVAMLLVEVKKNRVGIPMLKRSLILLNPLVMKKLPMTKQVSLATTKFIWKNYLVILPKRTLIELKILKKVLNSSWSSLKQTLKILIFILQRTMTHKT